MDQNLLRGLFISSIFLNPVPKTTHCKLEESADDNFKFDENGGKTSERVKKYTLGKGKIARNEQFLLFPQSFRKIWYFRHVKRITCLGKG